MKIRNLIPLPTSTILFMFLPFLFFAASISSPTATQLTSDLLLVPSTTFVSVLQSAVGEIQNTLSIISQFSGQFGDLRLSNAIDDCVDLLDFSTDELANSLSASQNANTQINGASTGNPRSDLSTWLSAAFGNQDTCLEGFDGTDGIAKELIADGLYQVTSLVGQVLNMVRQVPGPNDVLPSTNHVQKLHKEVQEYFPHWVTNGNRKLLQTPVGGMRVDATVAQDGTGDFTTVMEAVRATPDKSKSRFVIYIKGGLYKENVEIKKKKWNIMMVGDGMGVTVISGDRSYVDGWTTFRSATFAVSGLGFIARDMTFENTAGPTKHQAVALRSDADLSAFYRCSIDGHQDTLYAHSLRQFYRECRISGTVDFIFGNGAVVFQDCQIIARKALPNQKNSITAQGRKDPNQNTGFIIQFSNVTAENELADTPTYLGRPWKQYSRTLFMQSYMGSLVKPQGWLEWQGNFALRTLFYAEYQNYGPGATLSARVNWPGYHPISDPKEANDYTVGEFLNGNMWLPSTGVKYTSGLALNQLIAIDKAASTSKLGILGISLQMNKMFHFPAILSPKMFHFPAILSPIISAGALAIFEMMN